MEPSYRLLGILRGYAPNGPAQQACSDFYGILQENGIGGRELELHLVNALQDGLAHGNWLWDVPSGPHGPDGGVGVQICDPNWRKSPTGAMPALVPCPHCDDGSDPDGPSPTGWCNRILCTQCEAVRRQTEEMTCGVCGGMLSVVDRTGAGSV